MNKREVSPAQARYRMRFATHAVPNSAQKFAWKLNRMWLGQVMTFVAVFSLIFSSIAPAIAAEDTSPEAAATEQAVTKDSETPVDESLDATPDESTTEDQTPVVEDIQSVDWTSNDDVQETSNPVELGVTYVAPQNSQVKVIFTKLPEKAGKLSIKEITLTDEEKDSIGAATNTGYDITSDMENGTFEYDLSMPTSSSDVQIAYTEDSEKLDDVKSVESTVSGGAVTATELDHFTFFIPILIPKIQAQDLCTQEPSVYRSWKITNNKNTAVNLTWKIQNIPLISPVLQSGTVTIPANSSTTFDTAAVTGFNFMTITGGGLILPVIELSEGDKCHNNTYTPCGTELVDNGGFEVPSVAANQKWDIYDSGSNNIGWKATWNGGSASFGGGTRPDLAKIELQKSGIIGGWNAQSGNQYTELDSDWDGPSGSLNGEPSSLNLYQYIPTVAGQKYTVTFYTSPRPDQGAGESSTAFSWGGVLKDTINEVGNGSSTAWTKHTYQLTATSSFTKINFSDLGTPNSLGGMLDNVSVKQDCSFQICKKDDSGNPLAGWTVYLKGALADSVTVHTVDGSNDLSDPLPAGQYALEASGSYHYRNDGFADTSDAAYSKRAVGEMGATLANPWVRENDFAPGYVGWLGIQVNEAFTDWGSTFHANHKYQTLNTVAADGTQLKFRVLDDQYGDNYGTMNVDIYPIYSGVTNETGCVTVYAPKGNYTVDELMQDGWSNVTGQGVAVTLPGQVITSTLVNKCDDGCTSQVKVCKINKETGNGMAGWTVFLKGDEVVEDLAVNAASPLGATTATTLDNGKQYLVVASGQWQNRGFETVDPKFTTADSWATNTDAPQGGYASTLLELQVNDGFVNWGPYSDDHTYNYLMSGTGAAAKFRVYDFASQSDADSNSPAWYGDNVNSNDPLKVSIYEVYSGVTGPDGCVTLKDVPYGDYQLGEIQQDGWANEYGDGEDVTVNEPTEGPETGDNEAPTFTLSNYCDSENCQEPEPTVPQLHFIKVVCSDPHDVAGNESADQNDETDGMYSQFSNYHEDSNTFDSTLVSGFVNSSEIPGDGSTCHKQSDWSFVLSSDQGQHNSVQNVTTGEDGEYVTPISGDNLKLIPELQNAVVDGQLWVSEETKEGYDFAAIRCYDDALYGDNLEYIHLGDATPIDVYCIAYNIQNDDGGGDGETYSVSGMVYNDANNNGANDSEAGLAGRTVYADLNDDDSDTGEEFTTLSLDDGSYTLGNLPQGCYTIRETPFSPADITQPIDAEDNEYRVAVGPLALCAKDVKVISPLDLFIKTASAATFIDGDPNVTGADFGNYTAPSRSGGGSGGSGGNKDDKGSVKGDSTDIPFDASQPGQVLGATTLPVTGSPAWVLLVLALVALPLGYSRKFVIQKNK